MRWVSSWDWFLYHWMVTGDLRCVSDGPAPSLGGFGCFFRYALLVLLKILRPYYVVVALIVLCLAGFVFYHVVDWSPLLLFALLWLVWFRCSGHVMRIGWMPET